MSDISHETMAEFGRHVQTFKRAADGLEDKVTSFNAGIDRLEAILKRFTEAIDRLGERLSE